MDSVSDLGQNIFGHFNLDTQYLENNERNISNKRFIEFQEDQPKLN